MFKLKICVPFSVLIFYWIKKNSHLKPKNVIIGMVGSCVLKNKSARPRKHIIGSDKRYSLVHRCKKLDEIYGSISVSQGILLGT